MAPTKKDDKGRLTLIVSYTIVGAWIISFFVDLVVVTYDPPPSVHALMLIVAGAMFGEGFVKRTEKSEPKQESTSESEA